MHMPTYFIHLGLTGSNGVPGPVGAYGNPGPMGETGFVGPEGPEGCKGMKGERGDQGDVGPWGPVGAPGPIYNPYVRMFDTMALQQGPFVANCSEESDSSNCSSEYPNMFAAMPFPSKSAVPSYRHPLPGAHVMPAQPLSGKAALVFTHPISENDTKQEEERAYAPAFGYPEHVYDIPYDEEHDILTEDDFKKAIEASAVQNNGSSNTQAAFELNSNDAAEDNHKDLTKDDSEGTTGDDDENTVSDVTEKGEIEEMDLEQGVDDVEDEAGDNDDGNSDATDWNNNELQTKTTDATVGEIDITERDFNTTVTS